MDYDYDYDHDYDRKDPRLSKRPGSFIRWGLARAGLRRSAVGFGCRGAVGFGCCGTGRFGGGVGFDIRLVAGASIIGLIKTATLENDASATADLTLDFATLARGANLERIVLHALEHVKRAAGGA